MEAEAEEEEGGSMHREDDSLRRFSAKERSKISCIIVKAGVEKDLFMTMLEFVLAVQEKKMQSSLSKNN